MHVHDHKRARARCPNVAVVVKLFLAFFGGLSNLGGHDECITLATARKMVEMRYGVSGLANAGGSEKVERVQ